ncbi:hypothetical protein A2U01_0037228, partial [Trifolium medium]|nr:hypothetical protein [Trifolium medium]
SLKNPSSVEQYSRRKKGAACGCAVTPTSQANSCYNSDNRRHDAFDLGG